MKRRYFLCLVAIYGSVSLTGVGCSRKLQEKPAQSMPWQVFASKEGGFSVEIPRAPEFQKLSANISKYSVNLDNHEQMYFAAYIELPRSVTEKAEVEKVLRVWADAELQKQRVAAPDSEKPLSIQGYPGSEITFHSPNRDGGETIGTIRLVIADTKAYELAVLFSNGKGTREDSQRFFNSFRLAKR